MNEYFGYIRVSTIKQGEGVSLAAQKEAITNYAQTHKFQVTQWFSETETAAKAGRPTFTKMINDLHRGKATGVIIHKIDRSARNFYDWARVGGLADAGIEVHFVTESLDFQSRGGRLSADIQAVIAADYIRNLKEETQKGIQGRLKQGLYPFKAPFGYLDNGGGKVKTLDPARAPLIYEAFNLYASGQYSLVSLGQALTALGLRTHNHRPVTKNTISRVLRNPFYHGTIRIMRHGTEHPGIHHPLISKELFDQVQAVLNRKVVKKAVRHEYLYRGIFRCGLCSGAMTPESSKGFIYYRCHTKVCSTKCIREEILDEVILGALEQISFGDIQQQQLQKQLTAWFTARPHKPSIATSVAMQLRSIEERIRRTTDALVDGLIGRDEHQLRTKYLQTNRKQLQQALKHSEYIPAPRDEFDRFCQKIFGLHSLFPLLDPKEKRELIQLTTHKYIIINRDVRLVAQPIDEFLQRYELLLRRVFHRLEQDGN